MIEIPIATANTNNIQFQFEDRISSGILTITDTAAGISIELDSERIKKAPKVNRITVESILMEFSRKVGHDWRQ